MFKRFSFPFGYLNDMPFVSILGPKNNDNNNNYIKVILFVLLGKPVLMALISKNSFFKAKLGLDHRDKLITTVLPRGSSKTTW
jgi:hypothetical protein